jgi:hypothetical protein
LAIDLMLNWCRAPAPYRLTSTRKRERERERERENNTAPTIAAMALTAEISEPIG